MNKKLLIDKIINKHNISHKDAKLIVNIIIDSITEAIATGEGVEIRGFGSFSRKERSSYIGTNPKTLKKIMVAKKYIPFFKAGKDLRSSVKNIK